MNILIIATNAQRFLAQVSFAKELISNDSTLEITFYINNQVKLKYSKELNNFQFKIIENKLIISTDTKKKNFLQGLKSIIIDSLKKNFVEIIAFFKNSIFLPSFMENKEKKYRDDFFASKKKLYPLIKNINPDLILINGDRHLGEEPIFLSIAKELSIVTLIPYMVYNSEEEGLVKNGLIKVSNNFLTSKYIKKAQNTFGHHKRKNKYFYPHYISNVLMEIGVLSKNPWFMGGGKSDILSLPNLHMKEHYINHGIDKNKIKIIGDVSYDILYKKYMQKNIIKEDIIEKYDLKKNKKIIIVSLPQLAEHGILTWDEHWTEITFLLKNIDSLEQNVLISLHPKMNLKNYQFLEKEYNCKILEESLVDVLVVADMFVATFSSTVVWAVLCGINTIVVDFYGLQYRMYDFLTSIKKVDNKDVFSEKLNQCISETVDFTSDWKKLSKDEVFDGNTVARYFQLIKETI